MSNINKWWWSRWRENSRIKKEEKAKDDVAWEFIGTVGVSLRGAEGIGSVYINNRLKKSHILSFGQKTWIDYNAVTRVGKIVKIP